MTSCQFSFERNHSIVAEAADFGIIGIEELGEYDQVTAEDSCGCLAGSKRM